MQRSNPSPVPPGDADKAAWREWARSTRRSVDAVTAGEAISAGLEEWPAYRAARHVLVYLAFDGEPDLTPLLAGDKTFYATRTEEPGASDDARRGEGPGVPEQRVDPPALLTLHRLEPRELERHRYGFLQPSPLAPPVATELIDMVLVPGLAFDVRGERLGFGRGYYDRLLATLRADVPRVGIVPAALLVPRLPGEEHDVRMTHLASETGVFPVEG